MQSQSKGYLFLIIVLALTGLSAFMYTQKKYSLGLDVRGGSRITFKMDTAKLTPEQRQNMGSVKANLVRILGERVGKTLGVTEGNVLQKGMDEFIVELPGVKDVNEAVKILGSSASIQLYHAKNVVSPRADYREYRVEGSEQVGGAPEVWFTKTRGADAGKVLKPGDPEYAKMIEGWSLILQGDDLARAQPTMQGTGTVPMMEFSSKPQKSMN